MRFDFCPQEREILATLQEGRWPHACDPALRAHVQMCRHCADVVLVAEALGQARTAAAQAANLPAPGVLWWRAQLRRRQGALDRAATPVAFVEKLALVVTVLAALGLVVWQRSQTAGWLLWLADLPRSGAFRLNSLWPQSSAAGDWTMTLLIGGLGALALFGGLAVFFTTEKE